MHIETLRRLAETAALARTGLAFRAPGGTSGTAPGAVASVAAIEPSARPGDAPRESETGQDPPSAQESPVNNPGVTIELSAAARQLARTLGQAGFAAPGNTALVVEVLAEADPQSLSRSAVSEADSQEEAGSKTMRGQADSVKPPAPSPSPMPSPLARSPSAETASPLDAARVPTTPGAPALSRTPSNVPHLAGAIAETISGSGLFYESHLAEWVDGARTLAQIRTEPQNGPNPPAATSDQLQALSSGAIAWRGEVWPGQTSELMIGEEERRGANAQPATWHVRLALELPDLGLIEAHLALTGQRLDLRFATDSAAHRDTVAAATPRLLERLQAHGLVTLARVETQRGGGA